MVLDSKLRGATNLVAPDLLVTAAECGIGLRDALTAGSIDSVWVDFDPSGNLDCTVFVPVNPGQIFIDPEFDPARENAANVVLLIDDSAWPSTAPGYPDLLLEWVNQAANVPGRRAETTDR